MYHKAYKVCTHAKSADTSCEHFYLLTHLHGCGGCASCFTLATVTILICKNNPEVAVSGVRYLDRVTKLCFRSHCVGSHDDIVGVQWTTYISNKVYHSPNSPTRR